MDSVPASAVEGGTAPLGLPREAEVRPQTLSGTGSLGLARTSSVTERYWLERQVWRPVTYFECKMNACQFYRQQRPC